MSWQCLSIFRANFTTLDLKIEDMHCLLSLLNVLHRKVYKPLDNKFMKLYKQLKFKMKLAYEAWSRHIEVATLIHYAVLKTLQ